MPQSDRVSTYRDRSSPNRRKRPHQTFVLICQAFVSGQEDEEEAGLVQYWKVALVYEVYLYYF